MGVIGFSFTKFDCVRNSQVHPGQIEIQHNVSIDNVTKTSLNVSENKNNVLKIDFTFSVVYSGGLGTIKLSGDVIYTDTTEILDETQKEWDLNKKLTSLVNEEVSKFVYNKGIIKALDVTDSLNLPAPIPLMPEGMFNKKTE